MRWVAAVLVVVAASLGVAGDDGKPKVLVLGVDGLDPTLLAQFMAEGVLPNFEELTTEGDFSTLQTTMPPLSPIAWSTFITGMDPGGHGIYDFIHREASSMSPYMSMAGEGEPPKSVAVGSWVFPLASGEMLNLRKGTAFWEILEDNDVPTTIFRMPANFPPVESGGKAFSGMGTPDFKGTPGTFSFYSTRAHPNASTMAGGEAYVVPLKDGRVRAKLFGPENPFKRIEKADQGPGGEVEYDHPDLEIEFFVYLDSEEPVAKFFIQDHEFVLRQGEWSDWIPVTFKTGPVPVLHPSLDAVARFYLKQVRPDFELYVTPLQISPERPAMPIATPESWSHELWEELGYFYTQELPEDTKAFVEGVFTGREFWEQSQFIFAERRRALDFFLKNLGEGFTFFYFSSIDQGCHMLWHYADPEHPSFEQDDLLVEGIRTLYRQMDDTLGHVMESIDDDVTLVVMSDHGFAPFYRQVNLNTWLLDKGYVTLRDPTKQGQLPWFANVDWRRTRAYAAGLNGLYVNLAGRERRGIVAPGPAHEELLDQLEKDLLEMRDPESGEPVVTLVTRVTRDFHGEHLDIGPDIVVGFNRGYRAGWKSPLGEFPERVVEDNLEPWSGDHAMDYRLVPGVLITNKRITMEEPALYDLTVAILDEYGIAKTPEMIGSDCLGSAE